jgi:hypothetical protein
VEHKQLQQKTHQACTTQLHMNQMHKRLVTSTSQGPVFLASVLAFYAPFDQYASLSKALCTSNVMLHAAAALVALQAVS